MKTIAQLLDLSGRRAMVTGAAGYIGMAVCETLIELGARVAVLDKNTAACEKRAGDLNHIKIDSAFPIPVDLIDEAATRKSVDAAISRMNGLDILIHCAGYVSSSEMPGWNTSFDGQTVEAWDAAMRVNLTSAFILSQAAQEALAQSGKGSIVFIGSIYGMVGPNHTLYEETAMSNPAAYGVTKAGLIQLTRHLATTFAPRTRVNAISPGGVQRNQPEAFQERYKERTPLGRMAAEEDLKGAIAYLASDLSSYVTGHNLVVDGGWTAW